MSATTTTATTTTTTTNTTTTQLPGLQAARPGDPATRGVVLAVYAPFGSDALLSTYPDGESTTLAQHPLLRHLAEVAAAGTHVVALLDRVDDDTQLVEIDAFEPARVRITPRWKQDMADVHTLAGFLRHAHRNHPEAAIVLALEGHGAGFLPEIDRRQLSAANLTRGGQIEWRLTGEGGAPTLPQGSPILPQGSPILPQGSPILPQGSPILPANHMPLSTWALGEGLRRAQAAGVPRLAAIHFNNCFNMAVELLHTVAPYAQVATGYPNYNFFTAGAAYPAVFRQWQQAGSASALQVGHWLADGNRAVLAAKGNHPTAGCVIELARLHEITERLDDLADALLAALRTPGGLLSRQAVVQHIRSAIVQAQQYDTEAGPTLDTPDELTDLHSLARTLMDQDFGPFRVHEAAARLRHALQGIKRYGDSDTPWLAPGVRWDFSEKTLAMNIFLPDPLLQGHWDWRSPFYLDVNPDPTLPRVQPHIIDFVKTTDWVDFLIEYHKGTTFKSLRAAAIPEFPVFNERYQAPEPPRPPQGGDDGGCDHGKQPSPQR